MCKGTYYIFSRNDSWCFGNQKRKFNIKGKFFPIQRSNPKSWRKKYFHENINPWDLSEVKNTRMNWINKYIKKLIRRFSFQELFCFLKGSIDVILSNPPVSMSNSQRCFLVLHLYRREKENSQNSTLDLTTISSSLLL